MFFSKKSKTPLAEKPFREPVNVVDLEEIEFKNQLNVGLPVVHKTLGKGVIQCIDSNTVKVNFTEYEPKDLLIDICLENRLLFNGTDV